MATFRVNAGGVDATSVWTPGPPTGSAAFALPDTFEVRVLTGRAGRAW